MSVILQVQFHLPQDETGRTLAHQQLTAAATRIDLDEIGAAAVTYTLEQALTVVFHHGGMSALREVLGRRLAGWTVEDDDLHWGDTKMVSEEELAMARVHAGVPHLVAKDAEHDASDSDGVLTAPSEHTCEGVDEQA